jgi:hypothetical protein
VVRLDSRIEVEWDGRSGIRLRAADYQGNMVAARDHRQFDVPVPRGARLSLDTPLGSLESLPSGPDQIVRLTFDPEIDPHALSFFYFSAGRLHRLHLPAARAWEVRGIAPSGYNGFPPVEPGCRAAGTSATP